MGYTHYWRQQRAFTDAEWAALTLDVHHLFDNLPESVELAGGLGDGEPEANEVEIWFNGAEPDDYETFALQKEPEEHFTFCKTARKPYDLAVCAVLVLAEYHAPKAISVSSDGEPEDWEPAIKLLRRVFERLDYRVPAGVRSC